MRRLFSLDMMKKKLRVLHSPVNVGNQPWVLSRYERSLGVHSDLILNYNTWVGYSSDRTLGTYAGVRWKEILKRAPVGFFSPFYYDVLHCYFGKSLLFWDDLGAGNLFPYWDIKIAKKLGKKVYMTLQGCDVRLASESNKRNQFTPCANGRCSAFGACVSSYDNLRRKMISEILPLCDQVFFLNPELGHFLPGGTFLPYASAEVEKVDVHSPRVDRIPKIVHAPSDGNIKGTRMILDALESIRSQYDFEIILVKNKTHREAMELYKDADFAIDQVLAGWYGGFAVEMMAMGVPVMCWIREEDSLFLPKGLRADLPILSIHPENLARDIGHYLQQKDMWQKWSDDSRKYVLKWHNPRRIAESMIKMYHDPLNNFSLDEH